MFAHDCSNICDFNHVFCRGGGVRGTGRYLGVIKRVLGSGFPGFLEHSETRKARRGIQCVGWEGLARAGNGLPKWKTPDSRAL